MNIVRLNETIFEQFQTDEQCGFCWSYTYARMDYANLTKKERCCVHVFLEDFTEESIRDADGFETSKQYNYTLKILLDSLFDIQVFNELRPDEAKSKFSEYVEPILDCFPDAYDRAICSEGFYITRQRIVARYNRKDQNKDGIEIQYVIRQE